MTADIQIAATRIAGAGASFSHALVYWNRVAPKDRPTVWDPADAGDPSYDWSSVDAWVVGMKRAGLEPLLTIYGAPSWAQRCSPPEDFYVSPSAPCNPDPGEMAAFAEAAATRYSGRFGALPRVKYWQIQNEPNLPVFFNPVLGGDGTPLSPSIYRKILRSTYPAIKSGNPGNVLVGAGLAPNGRPGYSLGPLDFARRLFCLNRNNKPIKSSRQCRGGVKLDVFDIHPYTTGGPSRAAVPAGTTSSWGTSRT